VKNPKASQKVLKEIPLTDEYMTEQEQIEQLKTWLKQYGSTIIAGVAMSLIIMAVWHLWENYHTKMLYHASGVYDELLVLRVDNQPVDATVQAKKLLSHYPKTPYAKIAAFTLARDAVIKKDYPEAIRQLTWVVDHSKIAAMREIAKTRIARILISQNKPDEALSMLNKIDSNSFVGLVDEVRGDAYVALNDIAKAREAYQLALQELPKEEASQTPLLQIKLDNLITTSDSPQT
jgi:predicted negative regulator of RcsB-dependent stress response